MKAPRFPSYPKKPHASGQARLRYKNHDHYLGVFGSEASYKEYARLLALFATSPTAVTAPPKPDSLTIAEMIVAWHADAKKWSAKKELSDMVRASTVLNRLYGPTRAAEFNVSCLATVREAMISGSWMTPEEKAESAKRGWTLGWCKNNVNHMIGRVRRIFRFAESHLLVPKGTWEHLRTLRLLRKKEVRETAKRKPVEEEVVNATLPHLSLMIASMVRVQLLSGMRPSELCGMKADHFENGPEGSLLYRLDEWKTDDIKGADEWQYVVLGPEAQRIIAPWLEAARALAGDAFLWRPRPGKSAPYSESGYYQAVHDGCVRAGIKPWCPYSLRHSARRRITRECGIDAARSVLRHRTIETTLGYADMQDVETAAKAAKKIG